MVLAGLFLYIGETNMITMKKISVLGTLYDFIHDDSLIEQNHDGICKAYTKEIRVRNMQNMLEPNENLPDKRRRYDEVARHELIHAFFYEAGLDCYSDNEELVQWLAIQFPKMLKAFQEAECI